MHFEDRDEVLYQVVADDIDLNLEPKCLKADITEKELSEYIANEAQRPYDLTAGPLFRVTLLRLSPCEHYVVFMAHHLISDAASFSLLYRDLEHAYGALGANEQPQFAPIQGTYGAYEASTLALPTSSEALQPVNYWREQIAGAGTPAHLMRASKRRPSGRALLCAAALPARTFAALKTFCRREGCSIFMVAMAAYAALLVEGFGERDLVLSFPVSTRRSESRDLFGRFFKMRMIRLQVQEGVSFRALVDRTRDLCLQAYRDRDVPLIIPREYWTPYVMNAFPAPVLRLPGLDVAEWRGAFLPAPEISLELRLGENEIELIFLYPEDTEHVAQPDRYSALFARLLDNQDAPLLQLFEST